MRLSAIIPVHNGGEEFSSCLVALAASTRLPVEVLVVDDASTDGSGDLARSAGARVVSLGDEPRGPAAARNRGASIAEGDILVFIDADVAVHRDTVAVIETYFAGHPEIDALFGSYDDRPAGRNPITLYKNLQHHYVHQHGKREAATYWAGTGAIRRDVFLKAGGFDESYGRPSIEDVAFGMRLRQAGHRIWLCKDVQVTHLKQYSLIRLLRSDICDRAIPWASLIMTSLKVPNDLNLNLAARVSAVMAWLTLALLTTGLWIPGAWIGAGLALLALISLNFGLYRLFAQRGGPVTAVVGLGLHILYFLYSSLAFMLVSSGHLLNRPRQRLRSGIKQA